MQRQHLDKYAIAEIIRQLDLSGFDVSEDTLRADIARQFAGRLAYMSEVFNLERFLNACEAGPKREL